MRAVSGYDVDSCAGADGRDRADRGARRRLRDSGEFEREAAALAELAFDPDAAAMLFKDFLTDRQAKSGATAAFARDEDAENLFQVLFVDAAAVVDHGDAGHPLGVAVLG